MRSVFLVMFLTITQFVHSNQYTDLQSLSKSAICEFSLNDQIQEFPFSKYQICNVPTLGKFYVDDIPDSIKWHLKNGIYWESGIGEYVKLYTKPGTIAIDLGAHIGIHTLTMTRKVGKRGLVIAFEPQTKMFTELYHNLKLNRINFSNVVLLPFAAGETEKIIEMSERDPNNEGGTPIGNGGNQAKMITLDSLELSNVSFIKMDVESYELNVLKGAKNTILRNQPIIVFEILGGYDLDNCPSYLIDQYQDTIEFLEELGYKVERIFGNDFIASPEKNNPL